MSYAWSGMVTRPEHITKAKNDVFSKSSFWTSCAGRKRLMCLMSKPDLPHCRGLLPPPRPLSQRQPGAGLFPLRGICAGGLRGLVRAAKARNICINIGLGNQRPVKTETNRRTGNDQFTLISSSQSDRANFAQFGDFLQKKVSE